jgi:hypothetical protein
MSDNHLTSIGSDKVNPNHYKGYSKETIEMMVAIYGAEKVATYCECNAFKYRMRMGKKQGESIADDLAKERWYLDKAKELRDSLHL